MFLAHGCWVHCPMLRQYYFSSKHDLAILAVSSQAIQSRLSYRGGSRHGQLVQSEDLAGFARVAAVGPLAADVLMDMLLRLAGARYF